MHGSIERVRAVIKGETPDRPPLFDLLRNDAVIEHFAGRKLTVENGSEVVYKAYEPAIDATRPGVRLPGKEQVITLPNGKRQHHYRWTLWGEPNTYCNSEAYAVAKRKAIESFDSVAWEANAAQSQARLLMWIAGEQAKLGEIFFMPAIPGPGLMNIFGEVGLEAFCHYLTECPEIIAELLEFNTVQAVRSTEYLPEDHGIEAGFLGDDIAFHSGPLFSPIWLRREYFPRLARTIAAYHRRGIKVLFHSDGNLNAILVDLVEAGIDGLNPIEVLAEMDVGDIHRRYPQLFMAGGIDVSYLLPCGSPSQVRDAVKKAIDDAEGRIMIGSSTELNNDVPLANFLAMRDAVLESKYC